MDATGVSRRIVRIALAALVLGCHGAAFGQGAQPDDGPAFTVASVRASPSGRPGRGLDVLPGGRIDSSGYRLNGLIAHAYDISVQQIEGGPDWIDDDGWDIRATFASAGDPEADAALVPGMMRRLLAERFALRVRHEQQVREHYALVLARPDGSLGDGVNPSTTDCDAYFAEMRRRIERDGPAATPPPGPQCGFGFRMGANAGGAMEMRLGGDTFLAFARALQPHVGRLVQDETGLTGRFDFRIRFSADQLLAQLPPFVRGPLGETPPGTPSLFAALEEQLALKLEPRRGPVDVLVVEHAERPAPD